MTSNIKYYYYDVSSTRLKAIIIYGRIILLKGLLLMHQRKSWENRCWICKNSLFARFQFSWNYFRQWTTFKVNVPFQMSYFSRHSFFTAHNTVRASKLSFFFIFSSSPLFYCSDVWNLPEIFHFNFFWTPTHTHKLSSSIECSRIMRFTS